MTSLLKIAANRRNSQKSTGPRTNGGKQRSRFNALQTGIHADSRILPGESESEYQQMRDAVFEELQPDGIIQGAIADQIADDIRRLWRIDRAEHTFLFNRLILHAYLRGETPEQKSARGYLEYGPAPLYCEPNILDYKIGHRWRDEAYPNSEDVDTVLARTVIALPDRYTSANIEARRRGIMRDIRRNIVFLQSLQKQRLGSAASSINGSEFCNCDE